MNFADFLRENYEMTETVFSSLPSWEKFPILREWEALVNSVCR